MQIVPNTCSAINLLWNVGGNSGSSRCFVSICSPSLFYLLVHSRCRGCLFSLDHTQTHTPQSVGLLWTRDRPVAETSTCQHKHCTRQTSMPPVGFEPTISASARPQTYALDGAATGIGCIKMFSVLYWKKPEIAKDHRKLRHVGTLSRRESDGWYCDGSNLMMMMMIA
jgi:hypothetical protein